MEFLSSIARTGIESILGLYRDTEFAYSVAAVMTLVTIALILVALVQHSLKVTRIRQMRHLVASQLIFDVNADDRNGPTAAEAAFANRFETIDAELSKPSRFAPGFDHAWRSYARLLVFRNAPPVRATRRPGEFLIPEMGAPTWLGFAASIMVSFGLLATFLGLIAALSFATAGMNTGDFAAMQQALRELLAAAASKFVTSVAGVGLSIALRIAERILVARLYSEVDMTSKAIEQGIRIDDMAHDHAEKRHSSAPSSIRHLAGGAE